VLIIWFLLPLLILLIALIFDDSLVAPLLVLLYDCFSLPMFFCLDGSLFDWLIMMVLAALSTKITHFGCCSPLVLLTALLVYFSGLICNKLKA